MYNHLTLENDNMPENGFDRSKCGPITMSERLMMLGNPVDTKLIIKPDGGGHINNATKNFIKFNKEKHPECRVVFWVEKDKTCKIVFSGNSQDSVVAFKYAWLRSMNHPKTLNGLKGKISHYQARKQEFQSSERQTAQGSSSRFQQPPSGTAGMWVWAPMAQPAPPAGAPYKKGWKK